MEKRFKIEEIKELEMKLERLKTPKTIFNTNRKLVISERRMHHILGHRRYCA